MAGSRTESARQLDLFGGERVEDAGASALTADPSPDPLTDVHDDAARLAARLPPEVRFGTSSWSFPGWTGLVYRRDASPARLAREGLLEYAQHPLLRTVGIDRSYYAPIPAADLRRYAGQVPRGFLACAKAPASVMSASVPGSSRGGPVAANPTFLSSERLIAELIAPCADHFAAHCGPFVLECPPIPRALGLSPRAVIDRFFELISRLPREFTYAVELRNRHLLTSDYVAMLEATGAAHVYNYWSAMPMPLAQAEIVPVASMPAVVVRLLLRPGTRYEHQRERFRPFARIVEADAAMRADVVSILRAAMRRGTPTFVLVNNKAEGSAPLTIRALAEQLALASSG